MYINTLQKGKVKHILSYIVRLLVVGNLKLLHWNYHKNIVGWFTQKYATIPKNGSNKVIEQSILLQTSRSKLEALTSAS